MSATRCSLITLYLLLCIGLASVSSLLPRRLPQSRAFDYITGIFDIKRTMSLQSERGCEKWSSRHITKNRLRKQHAKRPDTTFSRINKLDVWMTANCIVSIVICNAHCLKTACVFITMETMLQIGAGFYCNCYSKLFQGSAADRWRQMDHRCRRVSRTFDQFCAVTDAGATQ